MLSLFDEKQADIMEAYINTTSRYWGDILNNVNNIYIYFDNMVGQIYPSEHQLNEANASDKKPRFLISNCPFLMILFLPKCTIRVTILI